MIIIQKGPLNHKIYLVIRSKIINNYRILYSSSKPPFMQDYQKKVQVVILETCTQKFKVRISARNWLSWMRPIMTFPSPPTSLLSNHTTIWCYIFWGTGSLHKLQKNTHKRHIMLWGVYRLLFYTLPKHTTHSSIGHTTLVLV